MQDQPRILIVEDDALTALLLQNVMAEMGCEVCGLASTGPRGVALADYYRPDLALVDVRLAKGTDGMKAARQMRKELKVDVVLITGSNADELDGDEEELPLVRKPFDTVQIKSAVRRMLEKKAVPEAAYN